MKKTYITYGLNLAFLMLIGISAGCGDIEVHFTITMTFGDTYVDADGYMLPVIVTGNGEETESGTLIGYQLTVHDIAGNMIHFATGQLDDPVADEQSTVIPFLILTNAEFTQSNSPELVKVTLEITGKDAEGARFAATYAEVLHL